MLNLKKETFVEDRLSDGKYIEDLSMMSPKYLDGIKKILTVSADTELMSAPAYYLAAKDAPTTNAFISAMGIIQDELGHAHIAYRLMEDLGVDKEEFIYDRDPKSFRYPYAFDVPLLTWTELAVANAFYDRAGFVLLDDVFDNTTFGPWKRALVKVGKEEGFHLRHGETWMKKLSKDVDGRKSLQKALDWMFPLTVEWFGLPDSLKTQNIQLEYGFKGQSNDQLRQTWMSTAVPLAESLGLKVPAHYCENEKKYVLEFPFPSKFDASEKKWLFEEGEIPWIEPNADGYSVMKRWRNRGEMNDEFVTILQKGHKQVCQMLERE